MGFLISFGNISLPQRCNCSLTFIKPQNWQIKVQQKPSEQVPRRWRPLATLGKEEAKEEVREEPASIWNAKTAKLWWGLCLLTPFASLQVVSQTYTWYLFPCISLIFSSFLDSCAKRGRYTSIQIEIQTGHHTQVVLLPVNEIRGIFEDSSNWLFLAWQYQRQTRRSI